MRHASFLLVLLASCTSPVYYASSDYGEVLVPREFGERTAFVVVRHLDRCLELVCGTLGTPMVTPVRVRVVREPRINDLGLAYTDRGTAEILLGSTALEDEAVIVETLGHELTHWQMQGAWLEVPFVVQEGIAYCMGSVCAGHMDVLTPSPAGLDGLDRSALFLGWEEIYALPGEEQEQVHRMGFQLVRTMGLSRIKALVEAGETSAEAFAAALDEAVAALREAEAVAAPPVEATPLEPEQEGS